jgi:hypothetical protein
MNTGEIKMPREQGNGMAQVFDSLGISNRATGESAVKRPD